MTDCSELKDLLDKVTEKAERLLGEADRTEHEYQDARGDLYFEGQKECGLHRVMVIMPDGIPGWGDDIEGQAECLREMERAREHARQDMERDKYRNEQAEAAATDAKGTADAARKLWCLCEAMHHDEEPDLEGEFGDWNEVKWDDYAAA
jgi:hypothetical protein